MENKFIALINNNKEIKDKINAAKSADEIWAIVAENIPEYTKEQFEADLKAIQPSSSEELSDSQLEAVAGGVSTEDIYISDKEFFEYLFSFFGLFS